jgi:hypothetical protein
MRWCFSGIFLAALAVLTAGELPRDLTAPGGGQIRMQTDQGNRVVVSSDYWRLEFDLRNGGTLDTIAYPHGSGKNLLVQPFRTSVGHWSDRDAPSTAVSSSLRDNVLKLEFAGRLSTTGRQTGPVGFRTVWTISPFTVRADHVLIFDEPVTASSVAIASATVRRDLNEFGVRGGPAEDPDPHKQAEAKFGRVAADGAPFIDERHTPLYVLLFHRNVEGFDLTLASDLETWEQALTSAGHGKYRAVATEDGIRLDREPLSVVRPVKIAKGEYTFSYYLGLPRIVEKSDRKWRHISFTNHPWPSDAEIAHWAESGVNIARLHNDYTPDENFWHDGAWPPYDEKGVAELRRVIATCHKHKIQVLPYFSVHELHPVVDGFAQHGAEWARTVDPLGEIYHNNWGQGEFGAQMCLESGWLERRKHDIETAYRELGFDGIYYDWVMQLACNNRKHNAKLHTGTDGVIDLLAWTRRLVAPKGTVILHLYGTRPSIAFENYADLVVNMEEISSAEEWLRMDATPLVTVLAESIPRSPCPSYRTDSALERNQNNIAQMVVQGLFPWTGSKPDSPVEEATLKLFRAFKPYDLGEYRFRDAFSGAVKTGWDDVFGALYSKPDRALVVVSNTTSEPRKNIIFRVKAQMLDFTAPSYEVKDTSTGNVQKVSAAGLADGTLTTQLNGYEYKVFEVSPKQ